MEPANLEGGRLRGGNLRLSRRLLLGLGGLAGGALAGGALGRFIYVLNYQPARFIYRGNTGEVLALAWSPNSQRIASGAEDLQIWDALSGASPIQFPAIGVLDVAWSPDGTYLASMEVNGAIKIWELSTGTNLLTYRGPQGRLSPDIPLPGFPYIGGSRLVWSADGARLLSTGPADTAQIWEALTGRTLLTLGGSGDDLIHVVAWSPDGRQVATGTYAEVSFWDAHSGALLSSWRPTGGVTALAWSPNGRHLAAASSGTVCLWETATRRQVLTYRGHTEWVQAIAWSPDSRHVASAGFDVTVHIWEASTGQTEYIYRGHLGFWQQFFSAQAPNAFTQATRSPLLTSAHLVQPQDPILPPRRIAALAWSPDGHSIASGGFDEDKHAMVQIWQPG